MRLSSLRIDNSMPVRRFQIGELDDVVVIAGPNGVGKTRLLQRFITHLRSGGENADVDGVIEATSPAELEAWGTKRLSLSSAEDMNRFRITLQASRRRRRWSSSLVNFDSDRSIQNLQPLPFSWDITDPGDEAIGWDQTFGFMRDRFQDTLHSMYRIIEAQKQGIATRAIDLKRQGADSMQLQFDDPMRSFKDVFRLLLGPKELEDPSPRLARLQYRIDGSVYDFDTLSSGEREVVNVAFDFLLRAPEDCIVFFDEPELHLHPELSYRLLRTLSSIGARNQFFFSTHSPDIISASLDRTVVFLSPVAKDASGNQAVVVQESDETNQALRLLGQSIGIIALGKRIVLVEGSDSSLDKQTYGSIAGPRWPEVVIVGAGSKHTLQNFSQVYDSVLAKSVWGVEFFMLTDNDNAPAGEAATKAIESGRLRVLDRCQVENYFLDEEVWAAALGKLEPVGSPLRDPAGIRATLRESARTLVSYASALAVAAHVRQTFGNVDIMPRDCHNKSLLELVELMQASIGSEGARLSAVLDPGSVQRFVEDYFNELMQSIDSDTDSWKRQVPGKPLLGIFASRASLSPARAKTLYINAAAEGAGQPFEELLAIFEHFATA